MTESRRGEKNPFFGRRHTEETRHKMSEAAKRRWKRDGTRPECYRRLMTAVVRQAVKDKALWFLESDAGKSYCDAACINPDKFKGVRV